MKDSAPRGDRTLFYFCDNSLLDVARSLRPSARRELEITDVNLAHWDGGKLTVELLGRGTAWIDTWTHEFLHQAPAFVDQWYRVRLSAENGCQRFVPAECAHGHPSLPEHAFFAYKCSDLYRSGADRAIRWDDPELRVEWPMANPVLLLRDWVALSCREWRETLTSPGRIRKLA